MGARHARHESAPLKSRTPVPDDFTGEKVEYQGESHTFVNADTLLGVFEGRVKTEDAFRPLRGRLLVSKDEMESCTSSGIAIAGQKNDDSNTGQVVAAGAGPGPLAADSAALATVNAGQYVMYDRYAAVDASIGDKKYVVVSEQDCIATWFGG
jgi:co-chaperonin GroES (HSP10)